MNAYCFMDQPTIQAEHDDIRSWRAKESEKYLEGQDIFSRTGDWIIEVHTLFVSLEASFRIMNNYYDILLEIAEVRWYGQENAIAAVHSNLSIQKI